MLFLLQTRHRRLFRVLVILNVESETHFQMRDAVIGVIQEATEDFVGGFERRQTAYDVKSDHRGDEEEENPHNKLLAALRFGTEERFVFAVTYLRQKMKNLIYFVQKWSD